MTTIPDLEQTHKPCIYNFLFLSLVKYLGFFGHLRIATLNPDGRVFMGVKA